MKRHKLTISGINNPNSMLTILSVSWTNKWSLKFCYGLTWCTKTGYGGQWRRWWGRATGNEKQTKKESVLVGHSRLVIVMKEHTKWVRRISGNFLVSSYDIILSLGLLNSRMYNAEQDVQSILTRSTKSGARMKFLEYKSIDLEPFNRRNNLIFMGHLELVNEEDWIHCTRFSGESSQSRF